MYHKKHLFCDLRKAIIFNVERESAERQKTIEDLPCMKRRKLSKKKRQINKILQEAATTVDENVQSYKRRKKVRMYF